MLGTTHYMQRAETNRYRVHFKDGKAYQFEFRVPKPKLKIVNSRFWFKWTVDNSKIIIDPKTGETFRLLADDWGYFVIVRAGTSAWARIEPLIRDKKGKAKLR